jgi:ribonuclease BN (tRNA processing enzyme)
VRITVLGKSPSWPDAGGACSGYLVEDGDTCVLLDCGSGVLGRLRAVRDYAAVDAVVVSHMHADHFFDLIPFACALSYGPRKHAAAPQLLLPPGGLEALDAVSRGGNQDGVVEGAFRVREYDVAAGDAVGDLALRFQAVPHFIPANAIEVAAGGARFTFGADHGPSEALCEFARDTDLLMLEATLGVGEPEPAERRGHLTAAEAGEHAARAGARRLVLTHISDELDANAALAAARRRYAGPIELAHAGAQYAV